MQVKEELSKHDNSVSSLMQNSAFVGLEVQRFQKLIQSAGQKWGGAEQQKVSYSCYASTSTCRQCFRFYPC